MIYCTLGYRENERELDFGLAPFLNESTIKLANFRINKTKDTQDIFTDFLCDYMSNLHLILNT